MQRGEGREGARGGGKGRYQTERWQQLVGREFGGKNESKHDVGE